MRKVHYKVTLDILVHENAGADVQDAIVGGDFVPEVDGDGDDFDIMDVSIESVKVTDSR